jgi:uncharacterized DUF497 family protein
VHHITRSVSQAAIDCNYTCRYAALVEFEWDEGKRLSSIEKHKIDFRDARAIFDGRPVLTSVNIRNDETRHVTTAKLMDRLYTMVWTWRNDRVRIISVRKARNAEERKYRSLHG